MPAALSYVQSDYTRAILVEDGNAMMFYDAALTAVSAVRLAEQRRPSPDAVADELGALQGVHTVLGDTARPPPSRRVVPGCRPHGGPGTAKRLK